MRGLQFNHMSDQEDSSGTLLRVLCKQNEITFLIDTGSVCSLLPGSVFTPQFAGTSQLKAANGTSITTYGQKKLLVDFALGVTFYHPFVVADVEESIIGSDFLRANNL